MHENMTRDHPIEIISAIIKSVALIIALTACLGLLVVFAMAVMVTARYDELASESPHAPPTAS